MWGNQQPNPRPKVPKPTVEDIAETLTAPDEYLWATGRRHAWGWATFLMLLAFLAALVAVSYIGGRQAYVFSGHGALSTPALRTFLNVHAAEGITLAQSAPAVPHDWAGQLQDGLHRCWIVPKCRANLVGPQWTVWRANAGNWFPQLGWAVKGFQVTAGGLLLALITYLFAIFEVKGWKRWEQLQRLATGKAERDRQRRGG